MIVTRNLLKDAMAALRENEKIAAMKTLIYSRYDFGSGLDFNIQQLKKGLAFLVLFPRNHPLEMIPEYIPAAKCTFVCLPRKVARTKPSRGHFHKTKMDDGQTKQAGSSRFGQLGRKRRSTQSPSSLSLKPKESLQSYRRCPTRKNRPRKNEWTSPRC
jgi:hypothetical protein